MVGGFEGGFGVIMTVAGVAGAGECVSAAAGLRFRRARAGLEPALALALTVMDLVGMAAGGDPRARGSDGDSR